MAGILLCIPDYSYSPVLLEQLGWNFFGTLRHLAGTVLHDLWLVSGGAWAKAFSLPDAAELGRANWLRYWLIVAGVAVGIGVYLFKLKDGIKEPDQGLTANAAGKTGGYLFKALVGFLPMKALGNVSPLQMLGIGLFAMLIAGWPYWVTGLPLALAFPNSRFTLSFMLGVSLLTAALIGLLPRWRWSERRPLPCCWALVLACNSSSPWITVWTGITTRACSGR